MPTQPFLDQPTAQFLAHAVLRYAAGDGPDRWAVAREVLIEHPEVAGTDIYAASACANQLAVRRLLAAEPESAVNTGAHSAGCR